MHLAIGFMLFCFWVLQLNPDNTQTKENQNMSDLEIRTIERNGVTLSPIIEEFKRRESKGLKYLVVLPDEKNLQDYIKWLGEKEVLEVLQRDARSDGQAALTYAIGGDNEWKERKIVDPESGKEVTQYYYDLDQVKWDDYYKALSERVLRGGETKESLLQRRDEMNLELRGLIPQMATNPTEVGAKMLELGQKLNDLDRAIEARSKLRRPKAEAA